MFFSCPEINSVYYFISLDAELLELFLICQADVELGPCSVNTEI